MANLKRNSIELVTGVEGDEVVTERYWTPPFIPLSVTYEALDLSQELSSQEGKSERDLMDKLIDFVATKIYAGRFTKEQLQNGLHAPDAIQTLQEQIMFIAQGQQSDATKKFLEKKD